MRVMVIGASRDRSKYGNRAVRAYLSQGHAVLPVNPNADEIEGVEAYARIADVPGPIDRATVYLPAAAGIEAMDELVARSDVNEVWLNPGADDPVVLDRARELGLTTIQACSVLAIGEDPELMSTGEH